MSGVAVYIRVSTHEQNLESQRKEINRWLELHQLTGGVVWYEDKQTGKNLKRPGFEALQAAIFAGEVKTVIVWRLDRLSRSIGDGLNVLLDWLNKGVRLISVTQQFDWSGAMGQMIATVLFAVAQMENEAIAERRAAGIAVAKAAGKYTGRQAGTTKANPERAKALRAQGLKRSEIAAALGVKLRTVDNYLRD